MALVEEWGKTGGYKRSSHMVPELGKPHIMYQLGHKTSLKKIFSQYSLQVQTDRKD